MCLKNKTKLWMTKKENVINKTLFPFEYKYIMWMWIIFSLQDLAMYNYFFLNISREVFLSKHVIKLSESRLIILVCGKSAKRSISK